jgi:hypothetical protein
MTHAAHNAAVAMSESKTTIDKNPVITEGGQAEGHEGLCVFCLRLLYWSFSMPVLARLFLQVCSLSLSCLRLCVREKDVRHLYVCF